MKLAILGFMIALVSAQDANTNSTSASTTSAVNPAPTAVSACAVQSTFELCLQNEDNYIKTCQEQDFACLCRWNKEKLTCWNNCPNDEGFARQEGVVQSLCSMPGANVSVPLWTSTMLPVPTSIAASSVVPTSATAVPTAVENKPSSASVLSMSQGALAVAGAVAAYMLF